LLNHLGCRLDPCRATGERAQVLGPQRPKLKIDGPDAAQGLLSGHDDEQTTTGDPPATASASSSSSAAESKQQAERLLRARASSASTKATVRACSDRAAARPRWHIGSGRRDGQVSLQCSQPSPIHSEGRQRLGKEGQPHIAQNPPNQRAAAGPRWTGNCDRDTWGIPFRESSPPAPTALAPPFHGRPGAPPADRQRVWHGQVQFDRERHRPEECDGSPAAVRVRSQVGVRPQGPSTGPGGRPLRRQPGRREEGAGGGPSMRRRTASMPTPNGGTSVARRIQGCSQAE